MFHEISEAYKILSNEETRRAYDRSVPAEPASRPSARSTSTAKTTKAAPGPAPTPTAAPTGKNLLYRLNISLEEGFQGVEKTIRYMRTVNGTRQTALVTVAVPAGIRDEKKLRIRGAGELSGQIAGDLIVVVHLNPHPLFRLEEADLLLTCPVTPLDLLNLEPYEVPTLHGPRMIDEIHLDEFQQASAKIEGAGYPVAEGKRQYGDLFVRFVIDVPESIDENLKSELKRLKKSLPKSARQLEFEKYSRS